MNYQLGLNAYRSTVSVENERVLKEQKYVAKICIWKMII